MMKLKRASRPNIRQKEFIANFMAKEQNLAMNLFSAAEGQKKRELWTELANTLNSFGGSTKSVDQWIKFWNDWKMAVYKKAMGELNALEEASSPCKEIKCLTVPEQMVYNITSTCFVNRDEKKSKLETPAENIVISPDLNDDEEIETANPDYVPREVRYVGIKRSLSENDMFTSKRIRKELEAERVAEKMLDLETKKVRILDRMLGCFEKIQRSIANIEAELL